MSRQRRGTGSEGLFAAQALVRAMSMGRREPPRIVVDGTRPRFDPNTNQIHLPGVPKDGLSDEALMSFRAYLDHEDAEAQITDWPRKLHEAYGNDSRNIPPELAGLVNAINDCRVDAWKAKQYPGSGLNIRSRVKQDYLDLRKADIPPVLNRSSRAGLLGSLARYVGEGVATLDEAKQVHPQLADDLDEVEDLLRQMPDFDSMSQDELASSKLEDQLIDIATNIHERLYKVEQQPHPEDEGEGEGEGEGDEEGTEGGSGGSSDEDDTEGEGSGSGDGSDESEDGDKPSNGGSEGDDDTDAEGEGSGSGNSDPGDSTNGDAESTDPSDDEGDGQSSGDTYEDQADVDPGEDFEWDIEQNMLDDVVEQVNSGQHYVVNTAGDRLIDYNEITHSQRQISNMETIIRQCEAMGRNLATRLRQALQQRVQRYRGRQDKGSVDPKLIHELAVGRSRVLRRRLPKIDQDVAVALSIDESSSMNDVARYDHDERGNISSWTSVMDIVRELSFIWNEAMAQLKIPFGIFGWTTMTHYISGGTQSRHHRLRLRVIKDFDSPPRDGRTLKNISTVVGRGGTPTGEGIEFAAERLARRPEKMKVLFVLTDGAPDYGQGHREYIDTVLDECKRRGILVIGIGVKVELGHMFDHYLQVEDAKDLVFRASKKLVKLLRHGR